MGGQDPGEEGAGPRVDPEGRVPGRPVLWQLGVGFPSTGIRPHRRQNKMALVLSVLLLVQI